MSVPPRPPDRLSSEGREIGDALYQLLSVRSDICDRALVILSIVAVPALIGSFSRIPDVGWQPGMSAQSILAALLFAVTLARRSLPFRLKAGALIGILCAVGFAGQLSSGLPWAGAVLMMLGSFFAFTLFGLAGGCAVAALALAAHFSSYTLLSAGLLRIPFDMNVYPASLGTWLSTAGGLALSIGGIGAASEVFTRRLAGALKRGERESTLLRDLIAAAPGGILLVDSHGVIRQTNRHLDSIFGYGGHELVGRPVEHLAPDLRRVEQLVIGGALAAAPAQQEPRHAGATLAGRRKDGTSFPIAVEFSPFAHSEGPMMIALVRDMTEQALTEQRLRQSEKLESIGQLAGGIAHDFNNLLGAIVGNLDAVEVRLEDRHEEARLIAAARRSAMSGAELVRQLLTFSRAEAPKVEYVAVGDAFAEMSTLLRRTLGGGITVEIAAHESAWTILVSPVQLQSAILNLAINARDAMSGGGRLVISAMNVRIDAEAARTIDAPEGEYVKMSVSDDGEGMPPETVARVFEPFFTTKGIGKGSGLGLSMVYGFVKQSGGYIRIDSEVGRGTTVEFYIPRARERREEGSAPRAVSGPIPRGTETVLLVEDSLALKEVGELQLTGLGSVLIKRIPF